MALHTCIACGDEVMLMGSGGQTGGRATLPPLQVLCNRCVRDLGLTVQQPREGGHHRTEYEGRVFLDVFDSAFVHSENPLCRHVYAPRE